MALISLEDVSLTFKVRRGGRVGLKEFVLRELFRKKEPPHITIEALKNVNLSIHDGERVGVIGLNGSGKSTLLRVLAGIYPPTKGRLSVEGKIDTLLDIGLGIEPFANGWDNIAYRLYLDGKTPAEVKEKESGIAEFSELGEQMKMPIRYYSSGMYVRLAFSLATAIEPEILLMDEIFGTGDAAFRKKAQKRMFELVDQARILVFVSHDLDTILKLCNRVVWLDHGSVFMDGESGEIVARYRERFGDGAASNLAA